MSFGAGSIALILIAALLLFGPKKLPELGRAAGNTLREFRSATKGLADDDDNDRDKKNEKQDRDQ
ncbi:sec-independent protein translocase protein TatA [Salsuginibacillus halophilus]|uniref:Sec-independent protein translocase protein TatA n=1 Tax=Salsuginibacillus halophilus TaxID=517424 RepID=A0A2P8HL37_9BACI|nr:twin-arginine translocase TatA/TatE family subunit [Salsuginibacillus halophilus]PSL46935.1 sec-independent protein translocase protein TatA [Salsuginibacillus halophilus]